MENLIGRVLGNRYEIIEKVGNRYTTEAREIENYEYIESTNNESGIIVEGTQEVIYYYTRIKTTVLVKYQDREGNELATDVLIEGQVGDAYRTEAKEIENYRFVEVTEKVEGIMTKEQIIVIYVYEKIPAKVIVKHLEKVIIEVEGEEEAKVEEKEILPEEIIEGYVGDNSITERKVIVNYKAAEPEPENKTSVVKNYTCFVYDNLAQFSLIKYTLVIVFSSSSKNSFTTISISLFAKTLQSLFTYNKISISSSNPFSFSRNSLTVIYIPP
jgi:hypothetical protein